MASDSHEIKITSDLQETVTHKVEGPPDLDAAIRSHLNALQGEGNIPGAPGSAANEALDTSQVSSADAFGPGGKFGEDPKPDPNQVKLGPSPAALNQAISLGATQANASPAIITAAPPAGAGPVSGMAGQVQKITSGLGKAFGNLGTIVGGVAGKFIGLAADSALMGAAIVGLGGTLAIATETIDSLFKTLASNWEGLSPRAAAASAVGQAELTAKKLRTEGQVGGDIAAVTQSRTDLQSTFIGLAATVVHGMAPLVRVMNETLAVGLESLNLILKFVNVIAYPLQWALAHFAQFMEFIRLVVSNDAQAMPLANFKNVLAPSFVHNPDLFYQQGLMPLGGQRGDQQHRDNPQLPNKPFGPDN